MMWAWITYGVGLVINVFYTGYVDRRMDRLEDEV
jgi:hypothetical protein